ncbi:MAG: Asp-tRNA(Asn)/Glu-tRNA(Gln) amidotransferase subunit GatB [Burkholderiales bacterium]
MQWEIVVGLETHAQLTTQSKMFSGASIAFGAAPNTQACIVDVALPGVLPVANRGAVDRAIRFGLAVGGRIAPRSVFARKNYFYPDLPKAYQISQYELPVVSGGSMTFATVDGEKTIRLTRAHLEEDAGKSLHEDFHGLSGIDLNRAGTPLLEIVSEPELRGSREAVAYAKALHTLVRWLDICDGNMQEGSFRCDANVSVRRLGDSQLGTRCEIKNLNSFRFMERAIEYEAHRQIEIIEDGGKIVQETRLYDPDKDETRSMRSKEDAQDYRYFPDPDLLPLEVSATWIEEVRRTMPELPGEMQARFVSVYGLSPNDAAALTASRERASYFESLQQTVGGDAKLCANWMMGDLASALNEADLEFSTSEISSQRLAGLIRRIADGSISGKMAKEVFNAMWHEGGEADAIIQARGLKQISDGGALEKILDEILEKNLAQVDEYRSGKEKVLGFFVGQAMKATQGKANPQQLSELLKRKLSR